MNATAKQEEQVVEAPLTEVEILRRELTAQIHQEQLQFLAEVKQLLLANGAATKPKAKAATKAKGKTPFGLDLHVPRTPANVKRKIAVLEEVLLTATGERRRKAESYLRRYKYILALVKQGKPT